MSARVIYIAWPEQESLRVIACRVAGRGVTLVDEESLQRGATSRFAGNDVWYVLAPGACSLRHGTFPAAGQSVLRTMVQNTFGLSLPEEAAYAMDFLAETSEKQSAVLAAFIPLLKAKDIQHRLSHAGLQCCGFLPAPPVMSGLAPDKGSLIIEAAYPPGTVCQVACRGGLPRSWRIVAEDTSAATLPNKPWIEDCFVTAPKDFPEADLVDAEELLPKGFAERDLIGYAAAVVVSRGQGMPFDHFRTADLRRPASKREWGAVLAVWSAVIVVLLLAGFVMYMEKLQAAKRLHEESQLVKKEALLSESLGHEIMIKRRLLNHIEDKERKPIKMMQVIRILSIVLPAGSEITSFRFDRKRGLSFECRSHNSEDFLFLLEQMKAHPVFLNPTLIDEVEEHAAKDGDTHGRYRYEIQSDLKSLAIPTEQRSADAAQ